MDAEGGREAGRGTDRLYLTGYHVGIWWWKMLNYLN